MYKKNKKFEDVEKVVNERNTEKDGKTKANTFPPKA